MYMKKDTPDGEVKAHTDSADLITFLKADGFYEIPAMERLVIILADALWSYLMPLVIASIIFATASKDEPVWFVACCGVALLLAKVR